MHIGLAWIKYEKNRVQKYKTRFTKEKYPLPTFSDGKLHFPFWRVRRFIFILFYILYIYFLYVAMSGEPFAQYENFQYISPFIVDQTLKKIISFLTERSWFFPQVHRFYIAIIFSFWMCVFSGKSKENSPLVCANNIKILYRSKQGCTLVLKFTDSDF